MIIFQLARVPGLAVKLNADEDGFTLEDNVKMYLLGLPNKLGPLGFIALHSVLESPEDIVDIKIGSFVPDSPVSYVSTPQAPRYTPATTAAVTPVGDLLSRKKAEMDLKAKQAAQSEQDLISTIISRRRRAVRIFQFESKSIFYTYSEAF